MTTWWLPGTLPFAARVALSALFITLVGVSIVALRRNQAKFVISKVGVCVPMLLFIGVYITCLVLVLSNVAVDPLDNRFLSPVYAPLVLVLTILVATAGKLLSFNKAIKSCLVICLTLWLLYPATQVTSLIHTYLDNGAGGFHQTRWARSDMIHYLAHNDLDGLLYNNAPHILYLGTGRLAGRSPRKYGFASRLPTNDLAGLEKSLQEGRPVYLVWFDGAGGEYSYSVEELGARFDMEQVVRRADGAIYAVRRKKR